MIVPTSMKVHGSPTITLQDDRLQFINEFCYLGHVLSSDMSSDRDIEQQRRKLCARGNALVRNFHFCEVQTKRQLFNSYCSSIYGSALWYNYTQEKMRRLRVCHNDILRKLLYAQRSTSATQLFVGHNLKSLDVLMRTSIFSLWNRVLKSENNLLKTLTAYDAYRSFRLHDEWNFRLFLVHSPLLGYAI